MRRYLRMDFVKELLPIESKKKITLNDSSSKARAREILMPKELIEQIFDLSKKSGYGTEEELAYYEKKQEYNKKIIEQIENIKFTKIQKKVLKTLYVEGRSLTEAGKILKKTTEMIFKIRNQAIKKIRKKIKYSFKCDE